LGSGGVVPDGGGRNKRTLLRQDKLAHKKRAKKCYGRNVPDDLEDKKDTTHELWFEVCDLHHDRIEEVGARKMIVCRGDPPALTPVTLTRPILETLMKTPKTKQNRWISELLREEPPPFGPFRKETNCHE
jgi:hypothetical protein